MIDPGDAPDVETPEEDDSPDDEEEMPEGQQDEDTPVEALNLLPLLLKKAPEWVKKKAADAVAFAKDDDDSRQDFMKRYANQLKLFAGLVKDLGYPAQGAKAPHVSMMTKVILHMWARVWDQVVPAKGDIVKCLQLAVDDLDRCLRVEKHMNWQLRFRMPDWATSQQFTILAWLIVGSTFRHYRWDPIAHTHVVDHVPIDDIIISYTETDVHPQMKNVERVTRILRMARWELETYEEKGFYSNLEALYPPEGEDQGSTTSGDVTVSLSDEESPVRMASDKIQGTEPPTKKSPLGKREIYEQHTYLKFPKTTGFDQLDGKTLPVIIVVDKEKKIPLAITLRQEPDPIDQTRYAQEAKAFEMAYQNAMRSTAMTQVPGAAPPVPPGAPPEVAGAAPEEAGNPSPGAAAPQESMEPQLPPGVKEPEPVRMNTIYRIVHFGLFPNPEGFYRLGIGSLLEGSNELVDVLAAEFMLSAKFQNMQSGFVARNTKHKGGDIQAAHGKFIETDLDPEQMKDAIRPFDFHPPSEGIMEMINLLQTNMEIGPSADIMSGEGGPSNETAKGMQIRNSNAQTLISVMSRLYLDSLKYELKLIAHGNSIYLDPVEYFPFTQETPGQPGQQTIQKAEIYRADYVEDVHLEFTADARMISKPERIADAKDFLQMILNSPLVQNPMLVDFAARQLFKVAEAPEYIAAMGPPPQPPPPPEPQGQDTENAGFFNEKDHPVFPDDDHLHHLQKIAELKQSPIHQHLSATGKQLLDRHERAHVAQVYLQQQALQAQIQKAQTATTVNGMARRHGLGGVDAGPAGGAPPGPPPGAPPGGPEGPPQPSA